MAKERFHEHWKFRVTTRMTRISTKRKSHDWFTQLPSISKTARPTHHGINVFRFIVASLGENSTIYPYNNRPEMMLIRNGNEPAGEEPSTVFMNA